MTFNGLGQILEEVLKGLIKVLRPLRPQLAILPFPKANATIYDLRDEGQKRKLAFSITGIWTSDGKPTGTNQSCKDLNKALKSLQKLLLGALEAILGLFRAVLGLSGESVDLFWCSLRVSESSFWALLDALGCPLDCLESFGRWTLRGPSPDPARTLDFDLQKTQKIIPKLF